MSLTRDQLLGAIAVVLLPTFGFLLKWTWDRWWRGKDRDADATVRKKTELESKVIDHADRIARVEGRLDTSDLRADDRLKAISRLEVEQTKLEGKVVGLQDFWRSEFGNLRKELREDHQKLREELRQDQASTEQRLTALMTGHQQRVHDRLNVIAADQAKMLTEFVDTMVKKVGE